MNRPYGMHPKAWEAMSRAFSKANVTLEPGRVVQTIGNAPASAGLHAKDGTAFCGGEKLPYCAAVDISIYHPSRLSEAAIRRLLNHLAWEGFAGWYRYRGSFSDNRHIHVVYAGCAMKPGLQSQVRDYLKGRTGLVGSATETFWTAGPDQDAIIKALFDRSNPGADK